MDWSEVFGGIGRVIVDISSWISGLTGTDIYFPRLDIFKVPDGTTFLANDFVEVQGSYMSDGEYITRVVFDAYDNGYSSIIGQFCNSITSNPIILAFVIMVLVFVGVRILRRLMDA